MRILALKTSLLSGSLALLEDEQLVLRSELARGLRTAQTLAPAIEALLATAHWRPADVELIAVADGPGSFTGLRVGVTTAKTLAYALPCEVIGVNTLEVIAHQATLTTAELWAVMDAQRRELFAAMFVPGESGRWQFVQPTQIIPRDVWLAALRPSAGVIGPGLAGLSDRLAAQQVAPPSQWDPQAETVGRVGFRQYQAGRRQDLWSLAPQYYRPSAAEEKRVQRPGSSPAS